MIRQAPYASRITLALAIFMLVAIAKGPVLAQLSGVAFWIVDALCFVVVPIALYALLHLPSISVLRAHRHADLKQTKYVRSIFVVLALVVGIYVTWCFGIAAGRSLRAHYPNLLPHYLMYSTHLPSDGPLRFLAVSYFAVTAGLVEEYIFRGLFKELCDFFNRSASAFVLTSSMAFALVHLSGGVVSLMSALFVGLFMSTMYQRIKDLRILIAAHALFDLWFFW